MLCGIRPLVRPWPGDYHDGEQSESQVLTILIISREVFFFQSSVIICTRLQVISTFEIASLYILRISLNQAGYSGQHCEGSVERGDQDCWVGSHNFGKGI